MALPTQEQAMRDIFDTDASTLDVIIYAVLAMLDLERWQLTGVRGSTPDERAAYNARQFVEHFSASEGSMVRAVKAIRQVSGLGLKDSKHAWDQTLETYGLARVYHLRAAKIAADAGDMVAVQYHLSKLD